LRRSVIVGLKIDSIYCHQMDLMQDNNSLAQLNRLRKSEADTISKISLFNNDSKVKNYWKYQNN